MRLVVGNNILIDYLIDRRPFSEKAMLLMELGYTKELELWMGTSQITDLIYVVTNGDRASEAAYAKEVMQGLRKMMRIYATDEEDFDAAANSTWEDIEDAFVFQTALKVKPVSVNHQSGPLTAKASSPTWQLRRVLSMRRLSSD